MAIDLKAILTFQDRATRPLMQVNKALERADRATNNYSRSVNKASNSGVSGFGRAAKSVGGLALAIGGAIASAKLLDATLGEAMRYQQQEVLVEAMFDDKKASAAYAKMVQKMAQDSPIMDTSTMMGSSKAFIGITKDLPALKQAWKVAEKLSIMDPEQGLQGAVYAMKELASGDGVSMAERFEMPKKVVNSIKNLSFDEQLVSIQKYLDKVGITDKTVQKMGSTTMSKFNQLKEKLQSTFRSMGTSGNSQIGKALDGILEGFDKGAFNKIAKQIDVGLGTALSKLANYVKSIDFVALGKSSSDAFTKMSNGIKWVSDNWNGIKETVIGVGTAIITFKGIMAGLTVISMVNTLMKAYRTGTLLTTVAQWNLNAALLANPIGLVIAAIAALIGIIVVLVRNWDTVTKRTKAFWHAIGGGVGAIRIVTGPLGVLIGAAIDLAKNWDSTKSVWENVWGAMKRSAAATVNSVIGGINEMIGVINKIPGVNIPIVPKVNWGNQAYADAKATASTIGNGGHAVQGFAGGISRVPYDNMPARLHEGERVLTKEQNKAYSNGASGNSFTFNVTMNGTGYTKRDADQLFNYFVDKVQQAAGAGA